MELLNSTHFTLWRLESDCSVRFLNNIYFPAILIKTCLHGDQMENKNYLSSSFPIENGLKHGEPLSLPLFNFALQYAIMKAQETNLGLHMDGNHQVLVYADDEFNNKR